MIVFELDYPPTKRGKTAFCKRYGLNAYYAGKHWGARKRDAEELHALTLQALRRGKVRRRLVDEPVEVRFFWDDRLDVDNHAVLGKAIVDALKGYLLPDDDRRWLKKVSHAFWEGGKIRVEVEQI